MSSKPIVLVTGGTGFVGSHVIQQLLEQDQYTVRATARSAKKLLGIFPSSRYSQLQIVEIPSLTADHSEALKGVDALIHVAAPLFNTGDDGKEIFSGAYNGAVNVVKAAIDAGVKKIVFTGTIGSTFGPTTTVITADSFGPIQSESDVDFEKDSLDSIYVQAKTLAEKKIWELAAENPDVDITVTLPALIFGPYVPNYVPANREGLGSMDFIYQLIVGGPNGPNTWPGIPFGHLVDVRDVAKTQILALSPRGSSPAVGTRKRFLTISKVFTWEEAAKLLRRERPEIANRLPKETTPLPYEQMANPVDTSLTENVLGFKKDDYVPWGKTVLDAVDELLRWEKRVGVKA